MMIEVNVDLFWCCSAREYHRGDELAWYADGDKLVRNEYNPATSYAFGKNFIVFMLQFGNWVGIVTLSV